MAGSNTAALFLIVNISFLAIANACGGTHGGSNGDGSNPSTPSSSGKCPMDTLKLGVCANVLQGLININIGKPPKEPCCPLLNGLVNLEAAVCLCTAIKANILGINLNLPIDLSLLLNYCGQKVPTGFSALEHDQNLKAVAFADLSCSVFTSL